MLKLALVLACLVLSGLPAGAAPAAAPWRVTYGFDGDAARAPESTTVTSEGRVRYVVRGKVVADRMLDRSTLVRLERATAGTGAANVRWHSAPLYSPEAAFNRAFYRLTIARGGRASSVATITDPTRYRNVLAALAELRDLANR